MTSQDIKNLSIVQDYVEKCWGLRDEDNAYLKERFFNPVIAPEYKNLNFDENFRAIYDFDALEHLGLDSKIAENDSGWIIFRRSFNYSCDRLRIIYQNYIENKIAVGKNEVKLKKVIENLYKENFDYFKMDFNRSYLPDNCPLKTIPPSLLKREHIEEYIIKIFETIGKYKTSSKKMKLVISFNYADWFLCSARESWSSCLNIERGEYWAGLPTLFGDDNRALLYITNGTKKSWNGVEVDSLTYRAWVLLDENNNKVISRFYPTSPINHETIKKITGDNKFSSYGSNVSGVSSKYSLRPICIKRDNLYITIYNDIVTLNERKFLTSKELYYKFGEKGGRQYVNFRSNKFNEAKRLNSNSSNVDNYKEGKRTINQDFGSYYCTKCGKKADTYNVGEESLCEECIGDDYYKCSICGGFHKKTEEQKTFKGKPICSFCHTERIRICDICGEEELKSKITSIK